MLGLEEGRGVKRPFFTSPDELLEEEYYDEQLPEKKRRLTPEQVTGQPTPGRSGHHAS
jgi:homeobox-leucine zipper protein